MCWGTGGQGRNKQGHASTSKSRQPTVETAACSIPGPTAVRLVLFHFTGGEAEPCAHTAALESMLLTDTLLCLPLQGQRGWGGPQGPTWSVCGEWAWPGRRPSGMNVSRDLFMGQRMGWGCSGLGRVQGFAGPSALSLMAMGGPGHPRCLQG